MDDAIFSQLVAKVDYYVFIEDKRVNYSLPLILSLISQSSSLKAVEKLRDFSRERSLRCELCRLNYAVV